MITTENADWNAIEKAFAVQKEGKEIFVKYEEEEYFVYDTDIEYHNIRFMKYGEELFGTFKDEMICDDDALIELEQFENEWGEASPETIDSLIKQVLDPENAIKAVWYEIKDDEPIGDEDHTDRARLVKLSDPQPEDATGKIVEYKDGEFVYADGSPIIPNAEKVWPKNPQAAFYFHISDREEDADMKHAYNEVGLAMEHNNDDSWKAYKELMHLIDIYDRYSQGESAKSDESLYSQWIRRRDSLKKAVNGLHVESPLAKYYAKLRFELKGPNADCTNIIEMALVHSKGSVSKAVAEVKETLWHWEYDPSYTVDIERTKMLKWLLQELEWQIQDYSAQGSAFHEVKYA